MIRVGIAGPIGSGKSAVLSIFESLGAVTIDADKLAKQIMVRDDGVRAKLLETFGPHTYLPDGSLNKPHLIAEAFAKGRVRELNDIVHPAVKRETIRLMNEAEPKHPPFFVIEGALLLNNGRPDHLDKILIIQSKKALKIQRVQQRDHATEQEILQRMAAQPDFTRLAPLADAVIDNNGTLDELREKVTDLAQRWAEEKASPFNPPPQ